MWAVTIREPGGPEVLDWSQVPDPVPRPGEVLVDVAAAALNRADLMQVQGHYAPPPGTTDVPGMECSGTIAALGEGVTGWSVGDDVCALLSGGGYAEQVAVPVGQLLPLPVGVDLVHAAALPEAACTVWSNLVMTAGLESGDTVLLHGGASGIGTMATQVASALGAIVAVTASREEALRRCAELGATFLINYTEQDFVTEIAAATDGRGADIILDVIGAKYLARNVESLAEFGRLVVIGLQGGRSAELDLNALMRKRASVHGTTLRSRTATGRGSKAEVVSAVRDHLWPLIAAGRVRPVVESVLDIREVAEAHRRMAAGGHVGKIVLAVRDSATWPDPANSEETT